MPLDLSNPRLALAGTVFGECSSGGRVGMENVASTIMTRVDEKWAPNVVAVCLAHAQFSCWSDHNRSRIEAAPQSDPHTWATALDIAESAMNGTLTNRVDHADSYFALSMRRPPFWARGPAEHVYSDQWHSFWSVRGMRPYVPNVAVTADQLNAAELAKVGA